MENRLFIVQRLLNSRLISGIIGFILLGLGIGASAQPLYFQKAIDFGSTVDIGLAIIEQEEHFYLFSQSFDLSTRGLVFTKLTKEGDTVFTKTIRRPEADLLGGVGKGFIETADSNFVGVGVIAYSNSERNAFVVKFNHNGDTLWFKELVDSTTIVQFHDIKELPNGEFIATGSKGQISSSDLWLVKFDSVGNVIWEQTYGNAAHNLGYSIDIGVDNGYIIGGYAQNGSNRDAYVLKVNNSGIVEWDTIFGNENGDACLTLTSDYHLGYLVYGGYRLIGNAKSQGFAKFFNSNGSIRWENEFGYSINENEEFNSATELSDHSFLLAGYSMETDSINRPIGWVMKISGTGDSLWSRRYSLRTNDHYITDIIETENKDILVCGYVFPDGTNSQDVWLLKLDSMGCLTANCNVTALEERASVNNAIAVYPNPFTESITIESNGLTHTAIITNMLGKEVLRIPLIEGGTTIETAILPKGMYLLQVANGKTITHNSKIVKQ